MTNLTLKELAIAKKLPVEFLRELGLQTIKLQSNQAVKIPYFAEDGEEIAVRYRLALDGDTRFRWRKGDKTTLYGLQRLEKAREAGYVLLVEGESDSWTAWYYDIPVLGVPGKSIWKPGWEKVSNGLQVFLWCEPGAVDFAERVGKTIPGLRVIHAPDGIKDLSELHISGKPFVEELEKLQSGATLVAEEQEREPARQNNIRPGILITNRFLREITADTLDCLNAANEPPELFKTGNEIVRIGPSDVAEPLTVAALRGKMDRTADYLKIGADGEENPARPPMDVAQDILALPAADIPFPELRGVRHAPLFLQGGRLLYAEGYDTGSGWLLRLHGLNGIRADMALPEARGWLDELFCDFPFADEPSRTHAATLLLQPFVRELITSPTPCYLIDAPTRGTGKGLLAEVATLVPTGGPAPVMSLVGDGDEVEKRITSLLLGGRSHIQLDNVRTLRSAHLEAALTTLYWNGRRLGKSEMVYLANRATWLATGNNVEVSDEMARRTIPIRLDAQVERPEDRTGFKRELPGWAHENRPALVSACLSIAKIWIDSGQPRGAATLGRYESWAAVMGGLLDVAGYQGFLRDRARLHGAADTETQEWMATVGLWWGSSGDRAITAGDLFELVKEHDLLMSVWGGRSRTGALQRMGHALSKKRDRVFGRYVIRAAGLDGVTRNAAYRLELCAASAAGVSKTPETPETLDAGTETPVNIDFLDTDAFGCFAGSRAKTPETPSASPGVLQTDSKNTRQNNWQKPPVNIDFLGVSGVSGVLNSPQTAGEAQEREPGEDEGEPWEVF
ncbi:MAG: hypothetical protein DDT21_00349 [Syntrophomonadaceae bacterium]|nr:hypothetical protein [Bacillota bacterium]